LLVVNNIESGYGRLRVLRGVTLNVEEGEIVAVLGPNGAGKTTTLRTLSGILPLWSGSITFLGKNLTKESPEARAAMGLGHVVEGRGILTSLSVEENLMLGRSLRRDGAQSIQRDKDHLLDLFPVLRERLKLPASSLSGGEQQMLALARSLLCRPRLLMIDEMSFGLAPIIVNQLFALVRQLRDEGTTSLIVEQQAGVLNICDRTFVLSGGRTVSQDDTGAAVSRADLVRSYLGDSED